MCLALSHSPTHSVTSFGKGQAEMLTVYPSRHPRSLTPARTLLLRFPQISEIVHRERILANGKAVHLAHSFFQIGILAQTEEEAPPPSSSTLTAPTILSSYLYLSCGTANLTKLAAARHVPCRRHLANCILQEWLVCCHTFALYYPRMM